MEVNTVTEQSHPRLTLHRVLKDITGPSLSYFLTTLVVRTFYILSLCLILGSASAVFTILVQPQDLRPLLLILSFSILVSGILLYHHVEPRLLSCVPEDRESTLPLSFVHLALFSQLFIITVPIISLSLALPILVFHIKTEGILHLFARASTSTIAVLVFFSMLTAAHFLGTLWPEKTLAVFRKKLVAYPILLLSINFLLLSAFLVVGKFDAVAVSLAFFLFSIFVLSLLLCMPSVRRRRAQREVNLFDDYTEEHFLSIDNPLLKTSAFLEKHGHTVLAKMPFFVYLLLVNKHRDLQRYYKFHVRLHVRAEDYARALALSREGLRHLSRQHLSSDTLLTWEAVSLAQLGNISEALDKLLAAIHDEQDLLAKGLKSKANPYLRLFLSETYWLLDDLTEARRYVEEVLSLSPHCPFALINKAKLLCEEAVVHHKDEPTAFFSLLDSAEASMQCVPAKYKPYYGVQARLAFIYLLRGAFLAQQDKTDEAVENFKTAINKLIVAIVEESHRSSRFGLALFLMVGTKSYRQSQYHLDKLLFGLRYVSTGQKFRLNVERNRERLEKAREKAVVLNYRALIRHHNRDVEKELLPDDVIGTHEDFQRATYIEGRVFPKGLRDYYSRYAFKY